MIRWNRREFMQASTATLLSNHVKIPALPGRPAELDVAGAAFVHTNDDGNSWIVGNSLVERKIRFDAQQGLHTESWIHKVTGTDFMAECRKLGRQGHEFSISMDQDYLAGSNGSAWELVDAKTERLTPSGESLIIHLRAKTKPAEITVFYAISSKPLARRGRALYLA